MVTKIIKVNPKNPEVAKIKMAARVLKKGGLVAFPTETVYGLGANALNKKAVRKIFKAKGRPLDNPVIVHIADFKDLFKLAQNVPEEAKILAKKFWPGPLTIVLFKKKIVPDEVTAGTNTLAVRMPKNKIALKLIRASGVPIAAPSANLAGRPSPITAKHVFEDLAGKIDLILDGGRTKIGVESTVLDLTVQPALILRPGGVSLEKLKKILKEVKVYSPTAIPTIVKSPGMKYRHYAPRAPLILIENKEKVSRIQKLINDYQKKKKKVGVMATQESKRFYKKANLVISVGSSKNLKEIARNLFKVFREFDKEKVDIIIAESVPEKGLGLAIMNRLRKASQKIVST